MLHGPHTDADALEHTAQEERHRRCERVEELEPVDAALCDEEEAEHVHDAADERRLLRLAHP